MILDPTLEQHLLETYPGTRLLKTNFSLAGVKVKDPKENRVWRIEACYAPLAIRRVRGVRFKVRDDRGFISFIEQLELELLLGVRKAGDYCTWAKCFYPEVENMYGMCLDAFDLQDDLFDEERLTLATNEEYVYTGGCIERRIHHEEYNDTYEWWQYIPDNTEIKSAFNAHTRWKCITKEKG